MLTEKETLSKGLGCLSIFLTYGIACIGSEELLPKNSSLEKEERRDLYLVDVCKKRMVIGTGFSHFLFFIFANSFFSFLATPCGLWDLSFPH